MIEIEECIYITVIELRKLLREYELGEKGWGVVVIFEI